MSSYLYRKSHCGDKMVVRPSYLYNGISYTGKMTPLYWKSPLVLIADMACHKVCSILWNYINMHAVHLLDFRQWFMLQSLHQEKGKSFRIYPQARTKMSHLATCVNGPCWPCSINYTWNSCWRCKEVHSTHTYRKYWWNQVTVLHTCICIRVIRICAK